MRENLHHNVRVANFAKGEFRPLFVASRDIGRVVIGLTAKTMANLRARRAGPPYSIVGNRPYYRLSDIEDWITRNQIQTSNDKVNNGSY